MTAVAFDTHAAVKKLKEAGFTEQQVEMQVTVLVEALASRFATRHDLKEMETTLTGKIESLRSELKGEMESLRSELTGNMENLRAELKGEISELRGEIESSRTELEGKIEMLRMEMKNQETRLLVRLGALMIVGITLLSVLMKVL